MKSIQEIDKNIQKYFEQFEKIKIDKYESKLRENSGK